MAFKIIGTGSCLPEKIVLNSELTSLVDTSDEWIEERTGIKKRHISTGETVGDLAVKAAKTAIEKAKIDSGKIDLIIVASCSSEMALPCVACQVQEAIGAVGAVAFDLNAACAGFLFALNTASVYLESGIYNNALIIGAEVLSKLVDWTDRTTCILFGDGAGAVYIERDVEKRKNHKHFFLQRSDGTKKDVLSCGQRENKNAFYEGEILNQNIEMDGREVFRFATRQIPLAIEELIMKAAIDINEIDYFILHQANLRIIETVAKRLNIEIEKFPSNVERVGNTSSASIPILLDELIRNKTLKEGMKIILSGFGAGLTYGACLIDL